MRHMQFRSVLSCLEEEEEDYVMMETTFVVGNMLSFLPLAKRQE